MRFLTSVPLIFGKGLNIWLGLVLFGLLTFQIISGLKLHKGAGYLFRYHKFNALFLIIPVGLIHAYYGIGIWFFGFKYGF